LRLVCLETKNFRNLKEQSISFDSPVSVLVGNNGHGKTSIIEAIFMLSSARSFRSQSAKELVAWNSDNKNCLVRGIFESSSGKREICFEYYGGKRTVTINGNPIKKASGFFGQFLAIVFTPDELQIVKGSPSNRRKFIDRILSMVDSVYVEELVAYQRALKNRNAMLSEIKGSEYKEIQDLIEPWDELISKHGRQVALRRKKFIDDIRDSFSSYYQKIVTKNSKQEEVTIEYQSSFLRNNEPLTHLELKELLKSSFSSDSRYRVTTKGVHRDEYLVSIAFEGLKKNARSSASQGQSRTATLALKLAAAEYVKNVTNEPPIILLDDVESELDSERVSSLYSALEKLETQVIISTTEVSKVLEKSEAKVRPYTLFEGELIS